LVESVKHAWQAQKLALKFYFVNLKRNNHLGEIRIDDRVILK
jgi:hypothetical protein